MIRLKWIILRTNATLDDLAEIFVRHKFSKDNSSGFQINLVNNENIEGEFIQRSLRKEVIYRPDSSEDVIEIERFSYLNFKLSYVKDDFYLVEVKNPPRILSDFLNYIHARLSHNLIADSVELDVMKVVELIKKNNDFTSVKIKKIKASSIALNLRTVASIEIQSHENAYQEFIDNFRFESFSIDYIKLIAKYNGSTVNLLIKKTGLTTDIIEIGNVVKDIITDE